jgi:hypothetical protein
MKNIKNFKDCVNEWLDAPGSVDVPGNEYAPRVNSRNYTPARQPLPEVVDAMYEASYFHEFLDNEGKSEEFNNFLSESKRSGSDVAEYIKGSFNEKSSKRNN